MGLKLAKTGFGFLGLLAVVGCGLLFLEPASKVGLDLDIVPVGNVQTHPARVAITIDDLPYVPRSKTAPVDGLGYVERINAALQTHEIIATGFAVGQQIDGETLPAMRAFAEAGHTIGNHSWSHPDYGKLTLEAFRTETERTDQMLAEWIRGPRYYRFPFLKEGGTTTAKAAAKTVLSELGYVNVPVTIDNDEWLYNAAYLEALNDSDTEQATKVAAQYIAHMQERTLHFQNLARDELGADVDHILLIHLNRLNADHLGTLLDWYAAQGWTFITVAAALKDPVYSKPDLYTGSRGLSQIERVLGRKSN